MKARFWVSWLEISQKIPFGVLIHTTWPMGHIVCGGAIVQTKNNFLGPNGI